MWVVGTIQATQQSLSAIPCNEQKWKSAKFKSLLQAHELGIVNVVINLGNGKSTTTIELRKKEDAKYAYISIAAVTLFMAFHIPRVVPNIVELISPEAARANVSLFLMFNKIKSFPHFRES